MFDRFQVCDSRDRAAMEGAGPVMVTSSSTGTSVGLAKGMAMRVLPPIGAETFRGSSRSGLRPRPLRSARHAGSCRQQQVQAEKGRKR